MSTRTSKVGQSEAAKKATAERRSASRAKTQADKADATSEAPKSEDTKPSVTVAELEAMSKTALRKAITEERAANKAAGKSGADLDSGPVQDWVKNPANATKREAKAKKSSTPRAQFPVIELAKGETIYNLDRKVKCAGNCGQLKPIRTFPTTTPEKRTSECRACRNERQNRVARAEAGEAYVLKAKAETPTEAPAKATSTASKASSKAAKAPQTPAQGADKATAKAKAPRGASKAQGAVQAAPKAETPPKAASSPRSRKAKAEQPVAA